MHLLQQRLNATFATNQSISFLIIFLSQFINQPDRPFTFNLRFIYLLSDMRDFLQRLFLSIVQLGTFLIYLFVRINQVTIRIYHLIRYLPHGNLAILVFGKPKHHVIILLLKLFYLASIKTQVNKNLFIGHGTDNGIFYKIGIQLRVEEDVLYGTRNILVLGTFHDGEFPVRNHVLLTVVAEDNVTIHLVDGDLRGNLAFSTDTFADTPPLRIHLIMFIDEPVPLKRSIYKTESYSPLRFGSHHTVGSILTHHLIDDVRIGVWEVECIKTLLLLGDAELKFIGIVEKQQSAEQCTLPHSLRTNEMYITIQFHLCIRNMGTVQKNNLIQVSHLAPPPI